MDPQAPMPSAQSQQKIKLSSIWQKNWLIPLLIIVLIVLVSGVVFGISLVNKMPATTNNTTTSSTSSQPSDNTSTGSSSSENSSVSSSTQSSIENVTKQETINYISTNKEVVDSKRWDLTFLVPSGLVIRKEPAVANGTEILYLETDLMRMEISGVVLGSGQTAFSSPPAQQITNHLLSSQIINRMRLDEVKGEWMYVGSYFTPPQCVGDAQYCAISALTDSELYIYCDVKVDTLEAASQCDQIVTNMSANLTQY